MTFYDNTKEDSRPWRADQDTRAQAIDTAAIARAAQTVTDTANYGKRNGIVVSPNTGTVSSGTPTLQLTATAIPSGYGTITWTSSNTGRATVNSAGLVTRVAAGAVVITASAVRTTGKGINPTITGTANITVS